MSKKPLQDTVAALARHYAPLPKLITSDPFELVLLENVGYLVSDERREQAFEKLRADVGLRPVDILSASYEQLLDVTRVGGMHPAKRVETLRTIAQMALQDFGGELDKIVRGPLNAARRTLKKFPSIGEPGADKILLFSRAHKVFALESNGLRVLSRLGYGDQLRSYAATYRSVVGAASAEAKDDFDWLIAAHRLLRIHGRRVCTNSDPDCIDCPVRKRCRFFEENQKESSPRLRPRTGVAGR